MMSDYAFVKSGKLKLKGDKRSKKKAHKRKHKTEHSSLQVQQEDAAAHAGWWAVKDLDEVGDLVAVELAGGCYLAALDNGSLAAGPLRESGEGPAAEEIFTALRIGSQKLALKSGFGKFLAVAPAGDAVFGRSEAIGSREQWEPVFQDGRCALQASNECFLGVSTAGKLTCDSERAGEREMVTIRTNRQIGEDAKDKLPEEERAGVRNAEVQYVRKFQSWQDHRLRLTTDDQVHLKRARKEGDLHETMLDRREKMKADRYCK